MGCASSSFLEEDDRASSTTRHHIVSLTSTTYGLLTTLDNPPPPPPPPPRSSPEVINSWELMEGLDPPRASLDSFEPRCPPGGEDSVVLYTTTLRGVRATFDECNAVRSALAGLGVCVKERDVSMDLGFREELAELMRGVGERWSVPRVFVRGRYVGGTEEVLRLLEEGRLGRMVEGMPTAPEGGACDGCGGSRFLPCFRCSGSRKVVLGGGGGEKGRRRGGVVVRCQDCNENGLVLCPICC